MVIGSATFAFYSIIWANSPGMISWLIIMGANRLASYSVQSSQSVFVLQRNTSIISSVMMWSYDFTSIHCNCLELRFNLYRLPLVMFSSNSSTMC
ncbi:hypothetical protein CEXT_714921 [Caerostris extrusa]|uniref:Uncharacterized protein n=1 Tax=Caerostris extrusa TaxID=172846 RepID=A0AAV4N1J6_CAEEX|nr:hypothetical protein CEXT_714921 [Caerostris extrusa]